MDLETPITTSEQLDSIVSERTNSIVQARLEREAKKYASYTSPEDLKAMKEKYDKQIGDLNGALSTANEKAAKYDADIAERDAKIKGYETASVKTRIAREAGLPAELADRLSGADEAAMRADAENLAKLLKSQQAPAPMYKPSGEGANDGKDAALRNLLKKVRQED